MHRIALTPRHYDLVRRFMVVHKLPNARTAAQHMIEVAAADAAGRVAASTEGADDDTDQKARRDDLLVRSHA